MSKKFRRTLFYSSILIFAVAGTILVLYAQGWRLDWETLGAQKVGAIYVRSHPSNANIFLDGKLIRNRSGLFQAGTLVNSLFPKTYRLRLTHPDYRPWERSVEVKPSWVTEVQPAVLVPKDAALVLEGPIQNFWMLNEEPVILNASGTLLLQGQGLPGNEVAGWTQNFERVLTVDTKTRTYWWNDPRNATSTDISAFLRRSNYRLTTSTELVIDPENTAQLLFRSPTQLALLDLARGRVIALASSTATSTTEIAAVAGSRFWLAWSEYDRKAKESEVVIYDKFFGTRRNLGTIGGKTVQLKWGANAILGFFQDDGEFYLYNPGTNQPTQLASDAQDFVFTPDARTVAVLGRKAMEVFDLEEREEYWRFALPEARRITGLEWHRNGRSLFVSYPGSTALLELDDLKMENVAPIASTDKVAYSRFENQFYYLDKGRLYRIDFPE